MLVGAFPFQVFTRSLSFSPHFEICEYPSTGPPRSGLFDLIWRSLAREIEKRELDTEEDDLLEVLQGFGTHIMRRAYMSRPKEENKPRDKDKVHHERTPDTLPLEEEEAMEMEE